MYKMLRISEFYYASQTGIEVFVFLFFCFLFDTDRGKKKRCLFLELQHDLLKMRRSLFYELKPLNFLILGREVFQDEEV